MDLESLKPVLSLLLWGALFFFMMRFGCGAHMAGGHGHHGHGDHDDGAAKQRDPVCGMEVVAGNAKAATVFRGRTYYFCSTSCRDKFEAAPTTYLNSADSREHHHG